MTESMFDHDRLDVYRLAIEYTAESFAAAKGLSGLHRYARGSALECAAVQDVLAASGGLGAASSLALKEKLKRIVSMLTGMTMKSATDTELQAGLVAVIDYEHEHRSAEHEHEEQPEPGAPPDRGRRSEFRWENRPAGGPGR
ncbi:MAG: 23S rRNA-intervening sequence protein [Pirellulales bacterium]|nr:23S rRNA-intervening sequence protein [Pirellulales bacterium]